MSRPPIARVVIVNRAEQGRVMQAVIAEMPPHWMEERRKSGAARWDEMWNGVLHMPPMPNRMHQNIALSLAFYLMQHWARPTGGRVHQEVNLTTPADEEHWTWNYRIPDLVLLDPPRFAIDKNEYMVGAPLVTIEVHSPRDEAFEKLKFYAGLGVPEVWIIDRDTRAVEIRRLNAAGAYELLAAGEGGWLRSVATGVEFRPVSAGKVAVHVAGDAATVAELPELMP